jgi:hypothetical protein
MLRHVSRNLVAKEARHNGPGQKASFCGDEEHWTERRKTGIVSCFLLVRPRLFPDSRQDVAVPSRGKALDLTEPSKRDALAKAAFGVWR